MIAIGLGLKNWTTREQALTIKARWADEDVWLVKPQTYMNRSGDSIQPLMAYYKIPLDRLVVIHDEVEFPFGKGKLQKNRSPGGHNGVRSVSERLSSNDYYRLRMGVGRPPHPEMDVSDHVLGRFSPEEEKALPDFLNRAGDAVECLIKEGFSRAATKFNV